MPPYQIVLALLQDSVLPLGLDVCCSLLAASWTFLRNLAHLLKFAKSSLNHDFHTLQANVHTKMIIMILHGKNEANFFKTRRWVSKNFFLMFKAVAYVALRFYPIFYLVKETTKFSMSLMDCVALRRWVEVPWGFEVLFTRPALVPTQLLLAKM